MTEHDYAAALAAWIEGEGCGCAADGLHLGPTDLRLVLKALLALTAITAILGSGLAFPKQSDLL